MISCPGTGNNRSESIPSTSAGDAGARQRRFDAAAVAADVVRVHRVHEHQVAVGVESAAELVAVEVQIALHGEYAAPAQGIESGLPTPLEAVVELGGGAVVQQRHPARESQSAVRSIAVRGVVVLAADERGIHPDRFALHGVEGDLVRAGDRRCGEDGDPRDPSRMRDRPLQRLHAAHRSAQNGRPALDPDRVGERQLRADLVADGQIREAMAPRGTVRGRATRDRSSPGIRPACSGRRRTTPPGRARRPRRRGPATSRRSDARVPPGRRRGCRRSVRAGRGRRCLRSAFSVPQVS